MGRRNGAAVSAWPNDPLWGDNAPGGNGGAGLLLVILIILLCAGCAAPSPLAPIRIVETVTVEVPVFVRATPPAELVAASVAPSDGLPVFVSPSDPAATSAMTEEGERALRLWILELNARLDAWRRWAVGE
jgi:hypothetical protein